MAALLITLIMGIGTVLLFILAEHKQEILENINFKEEGDTIERKTKTICKRIFKRF